MTVNHHPQDDLLIIETLIYYSKELEKTNPERTNRAWNLAKNLAESHDLDLEDAIRQIEYEDGMNYGED